MHRKINSERKISGEDLENLFAFKEFTQSFLDSNFDKYKDIIFKIGQMGPKRALDIDSLNNKFGKKEVDDCIQELLSKELIFQSITT
ncbi:hypothetical protein ES705_43386 [subsurface metagenome]